jgi:membrane associated rhomboid family serine protease
MIIPLKTDSPLRGVPWMNWALIVANVVVFATQSSVSPMLVERWLLNARNPHLYQFVTYAFLHADFWHLATNMLFLYIFGNNICDRLGNGAYLAFYLAGAVFAAVGYVPFQETKMLGASGAISAVTGAYIALMPRSHVTILYFFFLIGTIEIPSIWFILAYFAQDVVLNFGQNTGVAHLAHISGSIFGFLVCMILLKARLLPRDHFDMMSLLDRWNRRRQYASVVRQGYDPFGYMPQPALASEGAKAVDKAPPPLLDRVQDLRAEISTSISHAQMDQAASQYAQLLAIDPGQTLSRSSQLELANYLYGRQQYAAAQAYELFVKNYPSGEQVGQVYLMLGMAYGRYLNNPVRAKETLLEAIRLLRSDQEVELAKGELLRLG